jgi:antirestriction protein ArdC
MASNQTKEFRKSVADMFVKGLSEEGLNWKQGWATTGELRNAVSNRHYRGLNEFYLKLVSMVHGYKDPRWMTFNQIRDEGYHLEKGSKGAKVEYWFPFDTIKKKGVSFEEKERLINEGERKKEDFSLVAKYYTVFNGDNISGLPEIELPKNEIEPSVVLEQISRGMNVEIYNDGEDRAFYRPSTDDIHLPLPEVFSSDNEYNAVAFHELGHATGHESRLNRDQSGVFGTSAYAKEELVAEITSAFMAETTGISLEDMNMENHKAYVNGWITSIEDDPEYLMKAISQAHDAADYMQQFVSEKEIEKMISEEKHPDIYTFGTMPRQFSPLSDTFPETSLSINEALVMADNQTDIANGLWKLNLPSETNPWLKDTYECKGFVEADGYQEKKDGKVEDIYSPCVYKMKWDESEDTYKISEEVGAFTRIPTYNEFKTMYNLSDDDYIALAKEVSGIEISSSPEELNKVGFNSEPYNKDYLNSIGDIYLKCIEEKGFVSVPERTYESFNTINASNVHIGYGDNEFDIEVGKNTPIYVADDTSLESTKGLEFLGSTCYEDSASCTLDKYELFHSDLPDNPIGANFFRTENSELVIELISDDCSMKGFYPNNPFYKDNNIEKGELHNLYNKQVGTLKLAEMGENKSHTKASNLNKDLGSEI